MIQKKFLLLAGLVIAGLPALAQAQYYTCSTDSRGYSFTEQSRDYDWARSQAASRCRAHSSTVNSECDANVRCNGDSPQHRYNCSTFSKGLSFNSSSYDRNLAYNEAASQCRAHSSTVNAECDANVSCDGGGYTPPVVTCSTFSRGLSFENSGRDAELARRQAIRQCQDHPSTSNQDCEYNVSCNNGYYPPQPPPYHPPQPPPYHPPQPPPYHPPQPPPYHPPQPPPYHPPQPPPYHPPQPPSCKPGFNCPGDNPLPPPPVNPPYNPPQNPPTNPPNCKPGFNCPGDN